MARLLNAIALHNSWNRLALFDLFFEYEYRFRVNWRMVNESTCLKLQSMVMGVFATDELMGRSSTMTSAPKKKWIQHYMQGITQSVFSTKNHVRHFTLGIHFANNPQFYFLKNNIYLLLMFYLAIILSQMDYI